MDNDINKDTQIEVLKYEMDRAIKEKNEALRIINYRIQNAEEKAYRIKKQMEWYEKYLTELRQKREIAEIDCYRKLLSIHEKMKGIKERFK